MEKLSERLHKALLFRNMKQSELVEKTGIGKSSISTYLSGDYLPKQQNIYKIAKALCINEAWLMGYDDVPMEIQIEALNKNYNETENNLIEKYRKLDQYSQKAVNSLIDIELQRQDDVIKENIIPYENIKTLPLYPQLISAGTGQYVVDDIPADTIDVDGNIYRTATYAIAVRGDSMQPTYYDGDILIVDRQSVPEDNEVGIFIVDGMGYVKRRGKDELISDNKAYPNVKGNEGLCMGKVLGRI